MEGINVHPLGDNLLIEPLKAEETKTTGGIIIPEAVNQREPLRRARILAISEQIETKRQPGNVILFYTRTGTPITINGKECMLIKIGDVQAWVEE